MSLFTFFYFEFYLELNTERKMHYLRLLISSFTWLLHTFVAISIFVVLGWIQIERIIVFWIWNKLETYIMRLNFIFEYKLCNVLLCATEITRLSYSFQINYLSISKLFKISVNSTNEQSTFTTRYERVFESDKDAYFKYSKKFGSIQKKLFCVKKPL